MYVYTYIYTTMCEMARGNLPYRAGGSAQCSVATEMEAWRGREVQEGGDIYTYTYSRVTSLCSRNQHNIVKKKKKKLYPNLKKNISLNQIEELS